MTSIQMAIKALEQEPCGDAIDRAEAIKIASGYCHPANVAKELAKLPPVNPQPCEDAISRQAVTDTTICDGISCNECPFNTCEDGQAGWLMKECLLKKRVDKLPPVTPQPKTGHWIIIDDCEQFIAKCSECGRIEDSRMISKYPYCHCGAKMSES